MDALGAFLKLYRGVLRADGARRTDKIDYSDGGVFVSRPDSPGKSWTAGFGCADIIPDIPVSGKHRFYIAGYRNYNPATGMLDPQTARAVWLDDGNGGVVFCSVDCVGLFKYDVDLMRRRLARFASLSGVRAVNITSTHDHAGIDTMGIWGPLPYTGRDPLFMKKVYEAVETAVIAAWEDRRRGRLFLGYAHADPGMQRDDRLPQIFSDRITRLRFAPDDGSEETWLLNFASHSESLQGANSLVSADFPCYIRREIQRRTGARTAYFVGAIGGLLRMWEQDDDPVVSTIRTGERLGEIACGITEERELEPKLSFARTEFSVPADNTVLVAAARHNIIPSLRRYNGEGRLKMGLVTELSLYDIGGLKAVMLPGELFPELAYGGYLTEYESADGLSPAINPRPLCEICSDPDLLVFGLANDELGYIIPPNDFHLSPTRPYVEGHYDRLHRRHYEETNSLGPATAPRIAENFEKLVTALAE